MDSFRFTGAANNEKQDTKTNTKNLANQNLHETSQELFLKNMYKTTQKIGPIGRSNDSQRLKLMTHQKQRLSKGFQSLTEGSSSQLPNVPLNLRESQELKHRQPTIKTFEFAAGLDKAYNSAATRSPEAKMILMTNRPNHRRMRSKDMANTIGAQLVSKLRTNDLFHKTRRQ